MNSILEKNKLMNRMIVVKRKGKFGTNSLHPSLVLEDGSYTTRARSFSCSFAIDAMSQANPFLIAGSESFRWDLKQSLSHSRTWERNIIRSFISY